MISRLRRVFDDLAGRSHRRVIGILVQQIDAALDGVALAIGVTTGRVGPAEARHMMSDLEHLGDGHRARLVPELSATLTTPIDREDLFRLSRSIDDVLDHLRDYVRETDLYGVRLDGAAVALLEQVNLGLKDLRRAVNRILPRPQDVPAAALVAHKRAGQVRHRYGIALAALLSGEVDAAMLKRRELLRRLDVLGLRLAECADALADAMLKRML
ncbi:hypothetical protein GCM10027280_48900 [Micromonospora polyrhachis]|uniref:DUF47 family protein n=1 Tax=Micromonospora polyrhachis TaxID=1282883 RepID=A0A7W7SYX5_9ACTN|nr:DUF47 family protein [Micromonospora polyrhachis]MBB4962190.1 hypothetical protein [Micromonospora polyrhachis]